MILTCPACSTRYRIDDAAMADPAGRELRCAKCGHQWRYVPAPAAAEPVAGASRPLGPTPGLTSVPPLVGPAALESPAAPTPTPMPRPAPRRGSRAAIGCLLLIVLIAVAIAALAMARERIIAAWPAAARIYSAVGLRPEPLGAGLEIGKVAPSRNGDTLVVEGEVTNTSGGSRVVPRLRIALRDTGGKELTSKVIDPPTPNLAAGATARFRTEFARPSDAATGVAVTFSLQ